MSQILFFICYLQFICSNIKLLTIFLAFFFLQYFSYFDKKVFFFLNSLWVNRLTCTLTRTELGSGLHIITRLYLLTDLFVPFNMWAYAGWVERGRSARIPSSRYKIEYLIHPDGPKCRTHLNLITVVLLLVPLGISHDLRIFNSTLSLLVVGIIKWNFFWN
jgi:hypothetical protein